jgi:hypothetical protein
MSIDRVDTMMADVPKHIDAPLYPSVVEAGRNQLQAGYERMILLCHTSLGDDLPS